MDAQDLVERYGRAWEAGDVEAFLEIFTEHVRYFSHPFRVRFAADGRSEEHREYWHEAGEPVEPPPEWGV